MRTQNTALLANVFLITLAFIWLIPLAIMAITAFSPPEYRPTTYGGLQLTHFSIKNFQIVFEETSIVRNFINSLIIACTSVVLVVIFSSMAAYSFARMQIKGKNILFFLLISALMLPVPTLILPIFQINKSLGILDSHLGLIFPYAAFGMPFAIIILRSFFESLPKELEESAIIDGVSHYRIFLFIVLPSSWPAIAVVIIFQFMTCFNEFILALVTIDSPSLKPLSLVPLVYSGQFLSQPGAMFATLIIVTVPVILVFVFVQRFMVNMTIKNNS